MRFATILLVGLAVAALNRAAAQEPTTRLINDEANSEFLITIGPMELPQGAMEAGEAAHHGSGQEDPHAVHGGAVFPPVETVRFPISGYLYGFSYEVVDGEGRQLPVEVLHHLNLINPDHRELFLPISQRMLAVGKETGSQSMPRFLLGYPVPEATSMVVAAMLHNPTGKSHSGVEVRVRLKYVKAGRPWPLFNVYPFQLDVAFPAGDKSFDLPPGKSEWSYEASPGLEGRIMAIGGHVHENAESIKLVDLTENEVIWEGFPIEDEAGNLVGVTLGRLYRTFGAKIHPDHVYRVMVTYNNPTADTLVAGGMGVVGGVFMPSGAGMWPRADTVDPLYALDRRHYMRDVRGTYDEIAGLASEQTAGDVVEEHKHQH